MEVKIDNSIEVLQGISHYLQFIAKMGNIKLNKW